jgi:hypothetical protein
MATIAATTALIPFPSKKGLTVHSYQINSRQRCSQIKWDRENNEYISQLAPFRGKKTLWISVGSQLPHRLVPVFFGRSWRAPLRSPDLVGSGCDLLLRGLQIMRTREKAALLEHTIPDRNPLPHCLMGDIPRF